MSVKVSLQQLKLQEVSLILLSPSCFRRASRFPFEERDDGEHSHAALLGYLSASAAASNKPDVFFRLWLFFSIPAPVVLSSPPLISRLTFSAFFLFSQGKWPVRVVWRSSQAAEADLRESAATSEYQRSASTSKGNEAAGFHLPLYLWGRRLRFLVGKPSGFPIRGRANADQVMGPRRREPAYRKRDLAGGFHRRTQTHFLEMLGCRLKR